MIHTKLLTSYLASALAVSTSMAQCSNNNSSSPPLKWDTHVHLFDPSRFPLSNTRSYTPKAATPSELLASSPGESFLLVQASVENGTEGLVAHLQDLQSEVKPGNVVRGEIIYGADSNYSEAELQTFHDAGVRVLRGYARTSNDTQATADEMKRLLEGSMGDVARKYGWIVSFQLAPAVWTLLEDFPFKEKLPGIPVIAEHLGSVNVPLNAYSQHGLQSLVKMMKDEVLTVKINALHRRGLRGNEAAMEEVIKQLIEAGPKRLIWGSDWPHVNSTATGLQPGDFLKVNETAELKWLEGFMPQEVFSDMLYNTPTKLFL
jgi:predicted TIM-barrel fold metal-dependent hydrolase